MGQVKTKLQRYEVGDKVFDGPSQKMTTIVAKEADPNHTERDDIGGFFYEVGPEVPLNPTGDGAFADRWRNAFEICIPEQAQSLKNFQY